MMETQNNQSTQDTAPAFRLSDVKRRHLRATPLVLLLFAVWIASILAVIALVRPLMLSRSPWYSLLMVLYLPVSFGILGYAWSRVVRWYGLCCPHCGATFVYSGNPQPGVMSPEEAVDYRRRCGSCHAVLIDLDS